jgi:steroid 5-alpha reductase family enzyme
MHLPDIVFSRILMVLVLVEFFADQQQWSKRIPFHLPTPRTNTSHPDFQQAKQQYQKTAKVPPKYTREELDRGFVVSGLWSWSRHPNFAAEQAIWVVFYQWACYESFTYVNWTFAGSMSYLLLFQGSTWLTEMLSAQKYPEYKEYQKLVGKFVPTLMPGTGVGGLDAPKEKQTVKTEKKKK